MLLRVSAAVPLLVRVMFCIALVVESVWLAKVRLLGDKLTAGKAAWPVPVTLMFVGVFEALLATVSVPEFTPAAVGTKLTESVAASPGVRVIGNVIPLVWKLPLVLFTWEIVTFALPLLVKMAVVEADSPTNTVPNERVSGEAVRNAPATPGAWYS